MGRDAAYRSRYLDGPYAPVAKEIDAPLVVRSGRIPDDLAGVFVRNGSNPAFEPKGRYHWFDGDAMVHAVHFADGKATYRNRFIQTQDFLEEQAAGEPLWSGIMERPDFSRFPRVFKDTANTDLVWYNNELLALWWLGGDPYRVRLPDLATCGIETFGATLTTKMSAHPKVDPRTGQLVFLDFDPVPPYLTVGVADAVDGEARVVRSQPIELDGPRLQHDIALTRDWVILFDFSFQWDMAAAGRGERARLVFVRDVPSRFGLLSRHDANAPVRWFETDPCFMYHVVNAWQSDEIDGTDPSARNEVHLVGCRTTEPLEGDPQNTSLRAAPSLGMLRLETYLTKWVFDLDAGTLRCEQLNETMGEFPRMDNRRFGAPSRYSYLQRMAPTATLAFDAVVGHDLATGVEVAHTWPEGSFGGETVFCPRASGSGAENDGYLVTFVADAATGASSVHVLDAAHLDDEAVCVLDVPQRVPAGYHTWWVSEAELAGQRALV